MFDDGVLKIWVAIPPARRGAAKAIIQWMFEGATAEFAAGTVTVYRRQGSYAPHPAAYDDPKVKDDTSDAVELERRLREMIFFTPSEQLKRSA